MYPAMSFFSCPFLHLLGLCPIFTFRRSRSIHRATPAAQEVVRSSGRGRIPPPPSALGDRWLGLLPTEVLHTASQRAAQWRLENPHQRYPIQRDHLDCGKVHIFARHADARMFVRHCNRCVNMEALSHQMTQAQLRGAAPFFSTF